MWIFMPSLHHSFTILHLSFSSIYILLYFDPKYKAQCLLTTLHNIYKAKKKKRLYNLFSKTQFSFIFLGENFEAG